MHRKAVRVATGETERQFLEKPMGTNIHLI